MKSTMRRVTGGLAAGLIAISVTVFGTSTVAGASTASAATPSAASTPAAVQGNDPDPLPFMNWANAVVDGLVAPVVGILNGPFS